MTDGVDYWKTADGVDLRELDGPVWIVNESGIEEEEDWFVNLEEGENYCGVPVMDRYDEHGDPIPVASTFASQAQAAASFAERLRVRESEAE